MKMKFTIFVLLCFVANLTQCLYAQTTGDYRSNVNPTGLWSDATSWETYNGSAWVAAAVAPSSTDGVITIQAGDSIRLMNATTIDQVQVQSGGILAIFNPTATTFTLNDGAGVDLNVDGKLYLSQLATLAGAGNIVVNSGGLMTARNSSIMSVPATIQSSANMVIENLFTLQSTLTNNGAIQWLSSNFRFNNGTFINNGTFTSSVPANQFFSNAGGTNSVTNSATGTITFATNVSVDIQPPIVNNGLIQGIGIALFSSGGITNNGIIAPGNPVGILQVRPNALNANSPTLNIRIEDGSGAGTGNDRLDVNGNLNLSNTTLNVTENPSAPLTTYTIMTNTSGSFTGTFANTNIPAGYTLNITATDVTLTKTSFALPLVWGEFTASEKDGNVNLSWVTLQEWNTSHFTIEHSTNGSQFTAIGTVAAKGNSSIESSYSFVHTTPSSNSFNYYRIKDIDIDGKYFYSKIVKLQVGNARTRLVITGPNPAANTLQVVTKDNDITIDVVNTSGVIVKKWSLQAGTHPMNISDLPAGAYHLIISQHQKRIDTQQIIKL